MGAGTGRPDGPSARRRWQAAGQEVGRRLVGALAARVADRVDAGTADAGMEVDRLGALLEAGDGDRAALEAAVAAGRGLLSAWERAAMDPPSPRAARAARAHEARQAAGRLVAGGALAGDGPGRVCLPRFGPATWRAVAVLRDAGPPAELRLAAAVALAPAGVLAPRRSVVLAGARPDPELAPAVARLHALGAARQALRDALLTAEARAAAAAAGGDRAAAAALAEEARRAGAGIAELDAAIDGAWADGVARAARRGRH